MGRSGKGKSLKKQGLNRRARKSRRKEKTVSAKKKQKSAMKLQAKFGGKRA